MKLPWLLLSILGVLIFGSPADAGQLLSWKFEKDKNRLVFITDEGVQPEAKLIAGPTRLVIELPNTTLERTTVKESYPGAIRGFRIGQSTEDKVNLVIELAPGYTIDPERVEFNGASATNWTVDLPSPRIADFPPQESVSKRPDKNIPPPPPREIPSGEIPSREDSNPSPQVQRSTLGKIKSPYIKSTSHGFFLDLEGDRTNQVTTNRQGDIISLDLQDITLPADLVSQSISVNEHGVETISFAQPSPNTARISLKVDPDGRNWRGTFSRIKGFILVPAGPAVVVSKRDNNPPDISSRRENPDLENRNRESQVTTIRAIALTDNDSKLSIRSNGKINARSKLVGNGTYEVVIDNAKLGEPFAGPNFQAGSPVTELKVRETNSSVILLVTTKLGVRLGNFQNGTNLIALPLIIPRPTNTAITPRPVAPQNRPLVIIDPGHGGKDPGTIGIGGIEEKDVVLPISLDVVEELRKQGIEVRLTRDRDNFISLEGRTDLANDINADLFVSIHANAINLSRPDVNGLETYYYKSGRRLAEVIHWNILNTVNIRNRNIRRARFFVLRHSTMPAVLVEVGFLTGNEDSSRLKDPNHRRQMAKAIARGIVQYIKENKY